MPPPAAPDDIESNEPVYAAEVYREIYHSVNDAIFIHDAETGELIDANERASELYGYSRAELRQLSVEDLSAGTPPYTQETAVKHLKNAAAGEPQVFEWPAETKDGTPFWVEVSMRRGEVDAATIVHVIVRDISDRKRKERELELSEARYRSLTEDVLGTSNVATIILDGEYEVVWTNQATSDYFGVNRDELIGSDKRTQIETWIKDIFEDPDRFAETVLATYDDNTYVERFECHVLPDSDRDERWLEHWSRPIETGLYEGGRIEHYQDITRLKRSQQEVERMNEQLRVLNRITRHDIRNDMNVVVGWSQELDDHVSEEGMAILDRIQDASKHVIDLTKTVRDFVEALGTDDQPELRPMNLCQVIEAEVAKRRALYPTATFNGGGEVPEVSVQANELLSSVFRNILNNAVQHNDADQPVVTIDCDVGQATVTVSIADNGPGIPNGQKDAIFGRGEDGLDDPAAGVGLYLVDQLIESYHGSVWVEDNEPTGSVFVVELPRAESTESAMPAGERIDNGQ